jgi:hypothetical protein
VNLTDLRYLYEEKHGVDLLVTKRSSTRLAAVAFGLLVLMTSQRASQSLGLLRMVLEG